MKHPIRLGSFLALLLFTALVLFANPGDRLLWGDEAETALIAANINRYGLPKTTDGKNSIALLTSGKDTNQDKIWIWSPWLDEYLTALSFEIFTPSTTAARLPSILIAFSSVLLMGYWAATMHRDIRFSMIAVLLYATNVAFLLHARQCRYYALVCLAQLMVISGYTSILSGRGRRGAAVLASGLIIQFYSNYILVIPNIFALLLACAAFRRWRSQCVGPMVASACAFFLFVMPWLIYAQPWQQGAQLSVAGYWGKWGAYLQKTNGHIVPLVVFLLPALSQALKKRSSSRPESDSAVACQTRRLMWLQVTATLFIIPLAPGVYFRYLIAAIPVFLLLTADVVYRQIAPGTLRWAALTLLIFTNALAMPFAYATGQRMQPDMPLFRYLEEITSPYENRTEDVVRFFLENGTPEQSICVYDPEFPLIFYTHMHIIDARFPQNLKSAVTRNHEMLPDWILPRSASGVEALHLKPSPGLMQHYDRVFISVHDSPRGDSRPDPDCHVFLSAKKRHPFEILKKKPHL